MVNIARRINKLNKIIFANKKTPPFLIFFVTSKCNLQCKHCFYWERMQSGEDDLSFDKILEFSKAFGKIYNLAISGGEPFLRKDFAEICEVFYKNNKTERVSIPTNGSMPQAIYDSTKDILFKCPNQKLIIQLSIDGSKDQHDALRGKEGSFNKVIETYGLLAKLRGEFKNLYISTTSIVTDSSMGDLPALRQFITSDMPLVDNTYFGLLRGHPREGCVELSNIEKLKDLKGIIGTSSENIFEKILSNILFKVQLDILSKKRQTIDCVAGSLIGVIDSNGDVRFCELLGPIGNIRKKTFVEIWNSDEANKQRERIKEKKCYCTHGCFIVPSVLYHPKNYLKSLMYMCKF